MLKMMRLRLCPICCVPADMTVLQQELDTDSNGYTLCGLIYLFIHSFRLFLSWSRLAHGFEMYYSLKRSFRQCNLDRGHTLHTVLHVNAYFSSNTSLTLWESSQCCAGWNIITDLWPVMMCDIQRVGFYL